ncbi:MAG: universal stress protein [Archangiaceae bacterium]|nr:universal stress protein [Archangiaceae bacterium]
MKTILAATDGSTPALKGVLWAAQLARALGHRLELVYVSFPNLLPPHAYPKAAAEIDARETEWANQVLDTAARSVADLNVECVKTRRTGGPAEVLAELAERDDVWGVVIGAVGHSAASRVLLGSITDRLLHICSKPVLVVR